MNLSAIFIARPVATILLTAAIFIAGIIAFTVLPVAPLPQTDSPTISVSASLPGASADVMAATVATPLERQLGHIAGLTEMTSQSSSGSTNISLQFDLDRNINAAARDVQAAISAARTYLPANLPANPSYRKTNTADFPIAILGLTSNYYDAGRLYDAASNVLLQRVSETSGVGQVTIGGGTLPAVRVEANPLQLSHYGISLSDVSTFLRNQNAHSPKGTLSNGQTITYLLANDQLNKAADYRDLVIAYRNGSAVRLRDVAQVIDGTESRRSIGYLNDHQSVNVFIYKQPGSNTVETVDRIKAELPSLRASIPRGIDLTFVLEETNTIRTSLHDVERTLVISVLLVILVVFVFLRDWRSTVVPGIAVPVSIVGTFGVMYLAGYSLDNLSLMALTISTGFVIDDAIVVMENITRYLESGFGSLDAALRGSREVAFTVLSITLSLIAVFIPILMMGGFVGRLFREFSVTLAIAVLISMILSLTTTPMLCSKLLRPASGRKHGLAYRTTEKVFNAILRSYEISLDWVLTYHSAAVLLIFLLTIVLNVVYIVRMPKGFFPQQDKGILLCGLTGPQDASFELMNGALKRTIKILKSDPDMNNVVAFTGGQGASNSAFMFMSLKTSENRRISAADVVNRLRPKLARIQQAQAFIMAAQDLRIGGRPSNAQYQYTLQADSVNDLVKWAPLLTQKLKSIPQITDVNSDLLTRGLQAYLEYDRVTAARLGITPQTVDDTLNYMYSQAQVSTIFKPLNQYHVVLEARPDFTTSPKNLLDTYVQTSHGAVPLNAIAKMQRLTGPISVNHSGLYPSSTISFNLASNISLGDASTLIVNEEAALGVPTSVHGTFSGTAAQFESSLKTEPLLIGSAILAVYIVLGILYENLIHPLTILTSLPSASLGAVITLSVFRTELNIIALIGIILLIGIVKKNAIMMIDFALQLEREQGMDTQQAIFRACLLRFRPILMTTAAALFGAVPLALDKGMGAEFRRPLGLTIIGGLVVSQILTLYTTPVVYLFLDRLRLKFRRSSAATAAPESVGFA